MMLAMIIEGPAILARVLPWRQKSALILLLFKRTVLDTGARN
jgi:hypothetical protein